MIKFHYTETLNITRLEKNQLGKPIGRQCINFKTYSGDNHDPQQ